MGEITDSAVMVEGHLGTDPNVLSELQCADRTQCWARKPWAVAGVQAKYAKWWRGPRRSRTIRGIQLAKFMELAISECFLGHHTQVLVGSRESLFLRGGFDLPPLVVRSEVGLVPE